MCRRLTKKLERVLMASFDVKTIVKDKRFWAASFLIAWAAGLQGHIMWLQRQDSFKQKFGTIDEENQK
ncbi:hypothetical protein HID58_017325 [Brassica napus]|uniref:Uncharacterized protein n=3 Tax=Brassica TaxID=3705 RepID=A0ABQ8D6S8_BRANA|nr:hypothetical protein HID58_017325 [Brassica napus]